MSDWFQLEQDLGNWLSTYGEGKLTYKNSYQAIFGFPSDGFRSDGMLTNGKVLIALEIEAGQMHPDTNVGKYWLLQSQDQAYEKIILFHVFTPRFDSYGWRKKLGEFYAKKMGAEIPFEYVLVDKRESVDYELVFIDIHINRLRYDG
jgi:hypothetical protein